MFYLLILRIHETLQNKLRGVRRYGLEREVQQFRRADQSFAQVRLAFMAKGESNENAEIFRFLNHCRRTFRD